MRTCSGVDVFRTCCCPWENATMPVLEQLEERLLLSASSMTSMPASTALAQELDVNALLSGSKVLLEQIDSMAGQVEGLLAAAQGTLTPWESALMSSHLQDYVATPQPILVSPVQPVAPGARPVYFVNGILTTRDEAIADAQGLANQLGRPVTLIYNPTTGALGDLRRTVGDVLWFPPLPQPNVAVQELAGVLLAAWQSGQPVDIVGYSEGAAIANDAVRTMDALGLGSWTYNNVSVVLVGAPLGPFDAAGTAHFQRIDNIGDPVVELFGDLNGSQLGTFLLPASNLMGVLGLHSFLDSYVGQISPTFLPD
jgi:hypothetical protein